MPLHAGPPTRLYMTTDREDHDMSTTEATTTPTVERWRHRHTEVDAVRYDGTEHARRWLVDWVTRNGGETLHRGDGTLWIGTHRGMLPVQPGEFVVHGIEVEGHREWFPLSGAFAALAYYDAAAFDRGNVLDRDQAAALVVAADHILDQATRTDGSQAGTQAIRDMVGALVGWVHDLAATAEALR